MNFLKRLFSRNKEAPLEIPSEFLEEDPPDWIIELQGAGPPDTDAFSIRVIISKTDRTGTAETLVTPRTGESKRTRYELEKDEIGRLLTLLGFSFPQDIVDIADGSVDGIPIQLAIHQRQPYSLRTARCNLAGWLDPRKSGPPVVEIGRIVIKMRLQGEAIDRG